MSLLEQCYSNVPLFSFDWQPTAAKEERMSVVARAAARATTLILSSRGGVGKTENGL
jgi:hypothetical protein